MSATADFLHEVAALQDELRAVSAVTDPKVIEDTAVRLEGMHYAPTVVLPVDRFLRMTKLELLEKIEDIIVLSAEEVYELSPGDPRSYFSVKLRYISVLVYYFKQLTRLRRGVPEAWDEVHELYVQD